MLWPVPIVPFFKELEVLPEMMLWIGSSLYLEGAVVRPHHFVRGTYTVADLYMRASTTNPLHSLFM
jgi:hypothetical protein